MIEELNFYEWKKMLNSSKRTEYILFREDPKTRIEYFGEDPELNFIGWKPSFVHGSDSVIFNLFVRAIYLNLILPLFKIHMEVRCIENKKDPAFLKRKRKKWKS